jgi:squalene-associated FAD-dependent desaturase
MVMTDLSNSYRHCKSIASRSGSNFYRSFSLLGQSRREAMTALYAFARLADDATDSATDNGNDQGSTPTLWNSQAWHHWIDTLNEPTFDPVDSPACLRPIRDALRTSVQHFAIPLSSLHDIVDGVDQDTHGPVRLAHWEATKQYCHRVASSVGTACLAIWAKEIGAPPSRQATQAAMDCGVAFQLTNVLRDVAEDAGRGRVYLPCNEMQRFGVEADRWLHLGHRQSVFAINELGDWRGLIRLQIERAQAHYELGWKVAESVSIDGKRMFSLMWHTYRSLLQLIEKSPESIWQQRLSLPKSTKLRLAAEHMVTPVFEKIVDKQNLKIQDGSASDTSTIARQAWPNDGARVAVIGAGLAGIHTAMQLARNGCRVTLFEAKNRIGGRVGSFTDAASGQSVDYCQHVGMVCCTTLRQWITDTHQDLFWQEQDSLHFISNRGKRIPIRAWPIPAPYHLSGLLWRWPGLQWTDRIRVALALRQLLRMNRGSIDHRTLAIDWLREIGQNDNCIQSFWGTILVSALGEQVERVTLSATHKVLIDGFAAHRHAFHLLVPNCPLSHLMDTCVIESLKSLGVDICLGQKVNRLVREADGRYRIVLPSHTNHVDLDELVGGFDSVVSTLPWHSVESVLPEDMCESLRARNLIPSNMHSSPITGVHTWWDRAWLKEPHAILIDRLCQWVFPAPKEEPSHYVDIDRQNNLSTDQSVTGTKEMYYQIVISGSRSLPKGDGESILKLVKQDLAEVIPESAVASMLRGKVVTDPDSVFSVSPGSDASRIETGLFADKQLWFAGDWTQTGWPATMEGALRSGAKAAEGILQQYGRAAKLMD